MVDTGLPGKTKKVALPKPAEDDRLTRLDQCAGKEELRAQGEQYFLYQVVLAHGNPTRKQNQVALERGTDDAFQMIPLIARNGEPHRLRSRGENLRRHRIAVGVANLLTLGLLAHFDQFIAGGDDGDPRPPVHSQLPAPHAAATLSARGNACTSGYDHRTAASLSSHGNDVLAGLHAAPRGKPQGIAFTQHVLHHDHAIGPNRHRAPVMISTALPGPTSIFTASAGANRADHSKWQAGECIGGAAGKSVARWNGERAAGPDPPESAPPGPGRVFRAGRRLQENAAALADQRARAQCG